MTPLRLYTIDPETLEVQEVVNPPQVEVLRWVGSLISSWWAWMRTRQWPRSDDYARYSFGRKKREWDINQRLLFKWNLKIKLGR